MKLLILSFAICIYYSFNSKPIYCNDNYLAAKHSLPEPANGTKTLVIPYLFNEAFNNFKHNSSGFYVG